MERENLALTVAAALAPLLGGVVQERDREDTWRGWIELPDGVRIMVAKPYGSKGEIRAYLPRPGYPGESFPCGSIGADIARDVVKLARDVERRLLPVAREKAAAGRAEWAAQEAAKNSLAGIAAQFAGVPGLRVKIEKPGTPDQRIELQYYESAKGGLKANIWPSGRVYINNVSIYGRDDSSDVARLSAILAALST